MKKLIIIIVFLITCIFSFGNDWEFMSQGEHLIPLQIFNMAKLIVYLNNIFDLNHNTN